MAVTINGKPRITTTGDVLAEGGITTGTLDDTPVVGEIMAVSDSGQTRVGLESPAGQWRLLSFRTDTEERWQLAASNDTESGGNAGSNLVILRNDDDGFYIDTPLKIYRNTGVVELNTAEASTYLNIKNTNATVRARVDFADGSGKIGALDHYGGNLIVDNRKSGGVIYFDVHDTTAAQKRIGTLAANTTTRYLTLGDGTLQAEMRIDGAAGQYRWLEYRSGGSLRWRVAADTTAEGGSNAGSDFGIFRYSDAAGYLGKPLSIIRSSGTIYMQSDATVAQVIIGGSTATTCQLHLQSDDAASSELVFVSEGSVSALWRVNANEDLVWYRYNPPGTGKEAALTLQSSTGYLIMDTAESQTQIRIRNTNATHYAQLLFKDGSGDRGRVASYSTSDFYVSNFASGGHMYFQVNDTSSVIICGDLYAGSGIRTFIMGDGTGSSRILVDGAAGQHRLIDFRSNNSIRFRIKGANSTAEGGSNAGSNFEIESYTDAGAYLDTPFTITRSTGKVWLIDDVDVGGDLTVDGDIFTVAWADYFSSSTITGITSPIGFIRRKKVGNIVFVNFAISGTSSTSSFSFTLPYTCSQFVSASGGSFTDGGTVATTPVKIEMSNGSTTVNLYTNFNNAGWATSGSRNVRGEFWYEVT